MNRTDFFIGIVACLLLAIAALMSPWWLVWLAQRATPQHENTAPPKTDVAVRKQQTTSPAVTQPDLAEPLAGARNFRGLWLEMVYLHESQDKLWALIERGQKAGKLGKFVQGPDGWPSCMDDKDKMEKQGELWLYISELQQASEKITVGLGDDGWPVFPPYPRVK